MSLAGVISPYVNLTSCEHGGLIICSYKSLQSDKTKILNKKHFVLRFSKKVKKPEMKRRNNHFEVIIVTNSKIKYQDIRVPVHFLKSNT